VSISQAATYPVVLDSAVRKQIMDKGLTEPICEKELGLAIASSFVLSVDKRNIAVI